MHSLHQRFLHVENHLHHQFVRHSITALRIAIGAVFLGFGVLKYFPGVSPAQNLTEATTHILFLGLVPGDVAIVMIATLECTIGILLLANRGMRVAVWLLATEFVGILSPLVLLSGRLFAGPHGAPTLEGQYCPQGHHPGRGRARHRGRDVPRRTDGPWGPLRLRPASATASR